MSEQKTKKAKRKSSKVYILLVLIYLLVSSLPSLLSFIKGSVQKISGHNSEIPYKNLELLSAEAVNLSETEEWKAGLLQSQIPELKGMDILPDYEVYRFDVLVHNTGSQGIRYDGSVYLGSEEGDALQAFYSPAADSKERDTRFIPSGREATISVYGQVSKDTDMVYLKTYTTDDVEPRSIEVKLHGDGAEEATTI